MSPGAVSVLLVNGANKAAKDGSGLTPLGMLKESIKSQKQFLVAMSLPARLKGEWIQ
jgi:hypothetical protein